ncbi:serine/threonine receptor-like kinase NFP [Pistacia vera]|uniref:serine/threonine receptor-like kinase NFP n=1 Tax=Pistacia vera TaxID=55513 RepID=UPI001263867D|nr:serine/threonine receptor-like kinase NFP [Pistacia vera]
MTISLLSWEALFFLFLSFLVTHIKAQSPPVNGTDFSCSTNSPASCKSYVTYLAQSPGFMDLGNISSLFGVNRSSIARASNLVSEDLLLFPNQLLLVPITCGCTGNQYFANITYQIKKDDSYYLVSINSFENLTKWQVVKEMNPSLNPNLLQVDENVTFPLFCQCPSKTHLEKGIEYLITYVWQPTDNVWHVGANLNASPSDIETENKYRNFSDAVYQPVLIPVSQLPVLSQSYPSPPRRKESKQHCIMIAAISIGGAFLILLLAAWAVYTHGLHRKRRRTLSRNGSSLESSDLIPVKKFGNSESFGPKIIQDKLLPGVSGYLSKPIVYEIKVIMEATMNLSEQYRIGRSVYRATINGKVLAVKNIKENVTEELSILQRVNHANLVKLIGVSSDFEGNRLLVYEYAENGSLGKWLHPKSSTSSGSAAFLTWSQRLHVALDVANGLQYMHEHTQPSIVHRDIRTANILLDCRFKAKIANFSLATPATNDVMPKVDVFAFGVVLLELLSGKKAMRTKENGETFMLWKEISEVLKIEEKREQRLRNWMDPYLESFYPIDGAMSLATLARACTVEKPLSRPSMGEVVFGLSILAHSSETLERSWTTGLEAEEVLQVISPVKAR